MAKGDLAENRGTLNDDELNWALERVLAPLVEGDGGELYLVGAEEAAIRLHLGGRFSGCPGNALVTAHVIRPLLSATCPAREVIVTSGALIPTGAVRVPARPISVPPR